MRTGWRARAGVRFCECIFCGHEMTPGTRNRVRAGRRIAAQEPALILGYLQNRARGAVLPLERIGPHLAAIRGRAVPPCRAVTA